MCVRDVRTIIAATTASLMSVLDWILLGQSNSVSSPDAIM
jgi:hypothetical protein